MSNTLFQATHIWLQRTTNEECKASLCMRWQDVRSIEHDVNAGPDKWTHPGPITYLTTTAGCYHVLGAYDTWVALWHRYDASTQALLLSHN